MPAEEYPLGRLGSVTDGDHPPTQIDVSVAHPARMYDYYLHGKDNFPADREAAEKIIALAPEVRDFARANRAFLGRAVRLLAEQGVDQFLDIGTGIPTADNTHQVAQRVDPTARVVYVDNDPIVLAHARALMSGSDQGATRVIQADLRDPAGILGHPDVRATLDFNRPVGLILAAVLHFVAEDEDPDGILKQLTDVLPSGSHLVLSHATTDPTPDGDPQIVADANAEAGRVYRSRSVSALTFRSGPRIRELLTGFDLLEPGLVPVHAWRNESDLHVAGVGIYAAVGRKP